MLRSVGNTTFSIRQLTPRGCHSSNLDSYNHWRCAFFSTSCGTGHSDSVPSRSAIPPVLNRPGEQQKQTRYSGLQKQVLSLYRDLVKVAKQKAQNEEEKAAAIKYIRDKFKQKASWPKRDVDTIDAWVRRGKRQLQMLQLNGTLGISFVSADASVPTQHGQSDETLDETSKSQPEATRGAAALRKSTGGCSSKNS